jgi:putative transposase
MLYRVMRREGMVVNHKRIERRYREEGLSLRRRRGRKRLTHLRVMREPPPAINHTWRSISFTTHCAMGGAFAHSPLSTNGAGNAWRSRSVHH